MKIAMLGHKRIPSRSGGVEVAVGELAVRMACRGNEVYAYNRIAGEKASIGTGIHLVEMPLASNSAFGAAVGSLLATLHIAFRRFDIVHYHAEGCCVMLPLARLFGKRTVVTIHGLDWQRSKWGTLAKKYLLLGERAAAKYADALITLSPSAHDYFIEKYGRESTVIPNGVNYVDCGEPLLIGEYGLKKRGYILFLARITPEKGLHYLLEAFSRLKTDKMLVIAGSLEPSTPYIEAVLKKAGDPRIKLMGHVNGKLLTELFSNCFLYVLPSDVEGMPISLLEAVSCRARVLVSDIPENVGILRGYGHSFEKGSVDSLYDKLKELIGNEKYYDSDFKPSALPREAEKQLDEIIAAHDWNDITEQTLALYERVRKKQSLCEPPPSHSNNI